MNNSSGPVVTRKSEVLGSNPGRVGWFFVPADILIMFEKLTRHVRNTMWSYFRIRHFSKHNAGLMLAHCLRRWNNIKQALCQFSCLLGVWIRDAGVLRPLHLSGLSVCLSVCPCVWMCVSRAWWTSGVLLWGDQLPGKSAVWLHTCWPPWLPDLHLQLSPMTAVLPILSVCSVVLSVCLSRV